ncbi:MAG: YjbH domain-containing protein, partial [Candidatus Margulisbacteria bacterium]|nr:YjbH domain-containing protein [Candidatus Margulisiibacteriota bacterium]
MKKLLVLFTFILLFNLPAWAQDKAPISKLEMVEKILYLHGFENIEIFFTTPNHLIIAYENWRFKEELDAMGTILSVCQHFISGNIQNVSLIPKNEDIPLIKVTVPLTTLEKFQKNEISNRNFLLHITITENTNITNPVIWQSEKKGLNKYKWDFTVYPHLVENFDLYQPVILPTTILNLDQGFSLRTQTYLSLDTEGPYLLVGILSKKWKVNPNLYTSINLGYFDHYLTGMDNEWYWNNGQWHTKFHGGLARNYLFYTNYHFYTFGVGHFLREIDASLWVNYGRYFYGDYGTRV